MDHSLMDYHIMGGIEYMSPITLAFLVNILLIVISIKQIVEKNVNHKLIEAGKQLGGLALALGVFGTIAGLFQAFDAIEASPEVIPLQVICGGLKVALITVLYGLIIFCLSQLTYIILKLVARPSVS